MKKILILLVLLPIISCRSTEVNERLTKSLLGVVYDDKSNPIQGAALLFKSNEDEDFTLTVTTDIDGRFLIPELDFGLYSVEVTAPNCTPTKTEVNHFNFENVLIIKLLTKNDLIDQFKRQLFNKNLEFAKSKMEQIENIDSDDLYYNYLKSIYLIETDKYKDAESLLLKLIADSEGDPYVNLLLADLYQYHLMDNDKALKYLKLYIKQLYTEREYKRIKELESVI